MAKRQPKLTTICQDCLNSIPDKTILKYSIPESNAGPAYTIMLCKNCLEKREKRM
jgi:hypothetical protein